MSLWPFSSSTSNIALGNACATTASITTAASFWSPSSRSTLRAFGVRVPRRGPFDLPKTRASLLGLSGQHRTQHLGLLRRHALRLNEAVDHFVPAPVVRDGLGDELGPAVHLTRLAERNPGPETQLDIVGRGLQCGDAHDPRPFCLSRLVEVGGFSVGVVGTAEGGPAG